MCFVGNIIAQFHTESRGQETTIRNGCGGIPDFDDMELTLGRDSHADDRVLVAGQERSRETVDHAVDEHVVSIVSVHLLRPRTAPLILGSIP